MGMTYAEKVLRTATANELVRGADLILVQEGYLLSTP
jgi:hypothetical protein